MTFRIARCIIIVTVFIYSILFNMAKIIISMKPFSSAICVRTRHDPSNLKSQHQNEAIRGHCLNIRQFPQELPPNCTLKNVSKATGICWTIRGPTTTQGEEKMSQHGVTVVDVTSVFIIRIRFSVPNFLLLLVMGWLDLQIVMELRTAETCRISWVSDRTWPRSFPPSYLTIPTR